VYSPAENIKRNNASLLYVGSLSKRKGADLLPAIMDKLPGYRLICISRTSGELVKHPRIRVVVDCSRNCLVNYYRSSSVLISPSRLEGFGYTTAEAMACGTPVVCSDSSSLPELVSDGKDGYLVPVDDVSAFASAIRAIAEAYPNERKMFSQAARAKAESKFDIDLMVHKMVDIYNA
jgi:glycosyltransferase involved in cell wall biosynthesis